MKKNYLIMLLFFAAAHTNQAASQSAPPQRERSKAKKKNVFMGMVLLSDFLWLVKWGAIAEEDTSGQDAEGSLEMAEEEAKKRREELEKKERERRREAQIQENRAAFQRRIKTFVPEDGELTNRRAKWSYNDPRWDLLNKLRIPPLLFDEMKESYGSAEQEKKAIKKKIALLQREVKKAGRGELNLTIVGIQKALLQYINARTSKKATYSRRKAKDGELVNYGLLRAHNDSIRGCTLDPQGRWMVSYGDSGEMYRWDTIKWSSTRLRDHNRGIKGCTFDPQGRYMVSYGPKGEMFRWDTLKWTSTLLRAHTDWIEGCTFDPQGRYMVSYGDSGEMYRWDTIKWSSTLLRAHKGSIYGCTFDPKGRYMVSYDERGGMYRWDTLKWTSTRLKAHKGSIYGCIFDPQGRYMISRGSRGEMFRWDTLKWTSTRLRAHSDLISGCILDPQGRYMVSYGDSGEMYRWDTIKWSSTLLRAHTDWIVGCTFDPQGRYMVSYGDSGEMYRWDTIKWSSTRLRAHTDWIVGCTLDPQGRYMVSYGKGGGMFRWGPYAALAISKKANPGDPLPNPLLFKDKTWKEDRKKMQLTLTRKQFYGSLDTTGIMADAYFLSGMNLLQKVDGNQEYRSFLGSVGRYVLLSEWVEEARPDMAMTRGVENLIVFAFSAPHPSELLPGEIGQNSLDASTFERILPYKFDEALPPPPQSSSRSDTASWREFPRSVAGGMALMASLAVSDTKKFLGW